MSGHKAEKPIPRPILIGIAALLALTMTMVGLARLTGFRLGVADPSPVVAQRDLMFDERPDGSVQVVERLPSGETRPLDLLEPGTYTFVSGALRALARGHRDTGRPSTAQAVFRLTSWADGRLTLDDLGSGAHMELKAYGPTNSEAFARLLTVGGDKQ